MKFSFKNWSNNGLIQFTNKFDQQFLDYQGLKYPTSDNKWGALGVCWGKILLLQFMGRSYEAEEVMSYFSVWLDQIRKGPQNLGLDLHIKPKRWWLWVQECCLQVSPSLLGLFWVCGWAVAVPSGPQSPVGRLSQMHRTCRALVWEGVWREACSQTLYLGVKQPTLW